MELRDLLEGRAGPGDVSRLTRRYVPLIGGVMVLALVAILALTMLYRVDASDEGVVLRFGKHVDTVPPGLHWKLPWPIETVRTVPIRRIQSLEFGFSTEQAGRRTQYAQLDAGQLDESEMLTGDLNLARVEWVVQYRIKDPYDYLFQISEAAAGETPQPSGGAQPDANPAVPDAIQNISESVMRQLVGDRSVDAVLTFGRTEIANEAERQIQAMLDQFEAGVQIETVKLQNTEPPEQVQDAFQEVNRAKQVKERMVNEAEGERNRQVPAARGEKELAISEAKGYKQREVLEATGRIEAFKARLAEYEKAPEVTRVRLYLEAMDAMLSKVEEKTVIDASVRSVLPLLDLNPPTATGRQTATEPSTATDRRSNRRSQL